MDLCLYTPCRVAGAMISRAEQPASRRPVATEERHPSLLRSWPVLTGPDLT